MGDIVQGFPDKIKCKFEACDFKKMSKETVKAHEEDCDSRYVPCTHCDVQITLRGIAEHVLQNHRKDQVTFQGFDYPRRGLVINPYTQEDKKMQIVYTVQGNDQNPSFLFNFNSEYNALWISCVAPRKSLAKRYKYTIQMKSGKDTSAGKTVYHLEATRRCVPCDLSHEEVRKLGCCIGMDKETIADAIGRDNKLEITITISKV